MRAATPSRTQSRGDRESRRPRGLLGALAVGLVAALCLPAARGQDALDRAGAPADDASDPAGAASPDAASDASASAPAPDQPLDAEAVRDAPPPPAKEPRSIRFRFEPALRFTYTSNPFHLSDKDRRAFNQQDGAGQRFDDFSSAWDVIFRTDLAGRLTIPLTRKRDLKLGLGLTIYTYTSNPVATYLALFGDGTFDLTKRDHISLGLRVVPRRIRRSYRDRTQAGKVFRPGRFSEVELPLSYRRDLTKRWSVSVGYTFVHRDYRRIFNGRDRDAHLLDLKTRVEATRWLLPGLGFGLGYYRTNAGHVGGVRIDRSFDQVRLAPGVRLRLPSRWTVDLGLELRWRLYVTSQRADLDRWNRTDLRVGVDVKVRKRVAKRLNLFARFRWVDSDSNREDPTLTTDEAGYGGFVLGFGASWAF